MAECRASSELQDARRRLLALRGSRVSPVSGLRTASSELAEQRLGLRWRDCLRLGTALVHLLGLLAHVAAPCGVKGTADP